MATKGETTMAKTEYVIEPGRQDITSTIILDAPRELVFKAYTDPELFARWWGRHGFRGVNHDVVAPERICATFEYEGFPGHVALQTATFEALGNKTRLVAHIVFESVMDRDGMVASGMQEGADESMERLAELLAELKRSR